MTDVVPGILLPYQQSWMCDESRVRCWEKSRRIGASWVCAAESSIDASQGPDDGIDTWYTSYNKDVTQEYIRDCAWWSKIFNATNSGVREEWEEDESGNQVLTYVIRFPSGHRITALSSKPSNLRNRKGRIIVDEAAHMPDLGETLKAAMAILMWGGRVDVLSTHNGNDSQFNRLIEDIRAGRRAHSLHRTTIDDAVADGLYERICLVTGMAWTAEGQEQWLAKLFQDYGDDADEELRCIPRRSGGAYLSRLLLEDRMVPAPVFRFEPPAGFAARPDDQRQAFMQQWLTHNLTAALAKLPQDLMHAMGEDFGRTADLTVLAPCTVLQDLRRRIPFLVELRDTPFREQELAFTFVADKLPRFFYAALDATGNGQYLAERAWQRYGESRIEQIRLSDQWYWENLPKLKASIEDDTLDLPRDADVLTDMLMYQTINGIPKLPNVRKPQKAETGGKTRNPRRHGDAAIAILLAHYASRQHTVSYEGYQSAAKRTGYSKATVGGGFRSRRGGIL